MFFFVVLFDQSILIIKTQIKLKKIYMYVYRKATTALNFRVRILKLCIIELRWWTRAGAEIELMSSAASVCNAIWLMDGWTVRVMDNCRLPLSTYCLLRKIKQRDDYFLEVWREVLHTFLYIAYHILEKARTSQLA